jgi:hypothetical protein
MSEIPSPDHLDGIPEPAEIHRRIASAARTQRLLRRLLRLSLSAQRERAAVTHAHPASGNSAAKEVARAS